MIVLACNDDEDQLFDAIKAGAAAYVLKDIDPTDLIAIIRRVRSGEYLINDKVFAKPAVAVARAQGVPRAGRLRRRGAADLRAALAARGRDPRQHRPGHDEQAGGLRARRISEQTVKNHMSSILRKLSVNDRTQAVVYAMRQGWIKIPED